MRELEVFRQFIHNASARRSHPRYPEGSEIGRMKKQGLYVLKQKNADLPILIFLKYYFLQHFPQKTMFLHDQTKLV